MPQTSVGKRLSLLAFVLFVLASHPAASTAPPRGSDANVPPSFLPSPLPSEPSLKPSAARLVRRWRRLEQPEVTAASSLTRPPQAEHLDPKAEAQVQPEAQQPQQLQQEQQRPDLIQLLQTQRHSNPFIVHLQGVDGASKSNDVSAVRKHLDDKDSQKAQLQQITQQVQQQAQQEDQWMPMKVHREAITNLTTSTIMRRIANRRGQIILLVFQLDQEGNVLETLKNWAYFVGNHLPGRPLDHTLMIVPDDASYDLCRREGLPVYIDRTFPFHYWESNPWYSEVFHGRNRYFDVAKHWWGLKITEAGYSVLYMDMDMVILRDPLAYLATQPSASYDVQVQSDSPGPSDASPGFMLLEPCGIYKLVKEGKAVGGAQMREIWGLRGRDFLTQLQAQTPCASTGFWYIRPTPVAIAFQRMLVDRLIYSLPWGWDQVAWNEVVMAFLIGAGDTPPLRVRLFPLADVANIGTWENRQQHGLPADPLMIHTAGISAPQEKAAALAKHDYWHPERWDPAVFRNRSATGTMSAAAADLTGIFLEEWRLVGAGLLCMLAAAPVLVIRRWRHALRRQTNGKAPGAHQQ